MAVDNMDRTRSWCPRPAALYVRWRAYRDGWTPLSIEAGTHDEGHVQQLREDAGEGRDDPACRLMRAQ